MPKTESSEKEQKAHASVPKTMSILSGREITSQLMIQVLGLAEDYDKAFDFKQIKEFLQLSYSSSWRFKYVPMDNKPADALNTLRGKSEGKFMLFGTMPRARKGRRPYHQRGSLNHCVGVDVKAGKYYDPWSEAKDLNDPDLVLPMTSVHKVYVFDIPENI